MPQRIDSVNSIFQAIRADTRPVIVLLLQMPGLVFSRNVEEAQRFDDFEAAGRTNTPRLVRHQGSFAQLRQPRHGQYCVTQCVCCDPGAGNSCAFSLRPRRPSASLAQSLGPASWGPERIHVPTLVIGRRGWICHVPASGCMTNG